MDGPPNQLMFCAHAGRQHRDIHPADALFQRKDLHRGCCLQYALLNLIPTAALQQRVQYTHSGSPATTDERRGESMAPKSAPRLLAKAKRLLWELMDIEWDAMIRGVKQSKIEETLMPLPERTAMSLGLFDCGPDEDEVSARRRRPRFGHREHALTLHTRLIAHQAPLAVRLIGALRSLVPS